MNSNNAPQSFAPGGLTGFDQEHFQPTSQIHATGDVYSQPPSQGDMGHDPGNSSNQFQGQTGYRGLCQGQSQSQPNVNKIVGDNKAPSLTDMGHGQGNSYKYNHDLNRSSGLSGNSLRYGGQTRPPSHGDIRAGNVSQASEGHVDGYSKDGKAPDISDVDRRGSSETEGTESAKVDVPNVPEIVGISLVGKNFRKFYPNVYYTEGDEDN